jgi:hypothetical protein
MITSTVTRTPLLKRVLQVDAIATGLTGLLLAVAAGPLADLTHLPVTLLRGCGVFLVPVAALVAWMAARPAVPRNGVWALIALNVLWFADSVALLFTGWVDPNGLGVAFVLVQAVVVAVFAEFQYLGLRRA